jgi:hypothetical protein
MTTHKKPRKRLVAIAGATLMLSAAGAALILRPHDSAVRPFAMLLVIASAYLVRISNARSPLKVAINQKGDFDPSKGPGRLAWGLSIALLPLLGFSYLYLISGVDHGAHGALPSYVFAGVAFASVVTWSYLVAKLISRNHWR